MEETASNERPLPMQKFFSRKVVDPLLNLSDTH